MERFSSLCNTKNEPTGLYQIRLAWVLESDHEKSYTVKTIPFTVTPTYSTSSISVADNGDTILKQYQNGTIDLQQFYTELKARNWTDEQIRQALRVLGKLPHQMGFSGPDNKLPIFQTNSSVKSNVTNVSPMVNLTNQKISQPMEINSNNSAVVPKTTQLMQHTSTLPLKQNNVTVSLSKQNDPLRNYVIMGLSIAAAMIMLTVLILAKLMKKIKK